MLAEILQEMTEVREPYAVVLTALMKLGDMTSTLTSPRMRMNWPMTTLTMAKATPAAMEERVATAKRT